MDLTDKEARWFHYICQAAFWSLALFAFGATFLSLETMELPYLLMLFGECSLGLAHVPEVQPSPSLTQRASRSAGC